MGVRSGQELSTNVVAKTFTGVNTPAAPTSQNSADAFKPVVDARGPRAGFFNFSLSSLGGGTGTVIVERTFNDTDWIAAKDTAGNAVTLSAVGTQTLRETEPGVGYRMRCTALGGGSTGLVCRLSQ